MVFIYRSIPISISYMYYRSTWVINTYHAPITLFALKNATCFNISRPSDGYMNQLSKPSLVHRLFGDIPSSEPMVDLHKFNHWAQISVQVEWKKQHLPLRYKYVANKMATISYRSRRVKIGASYAVFIQRWYNTKQSLVLFSLLGDIIKPCYWDTCPSCKKWLWLLVTSTRYDHALLKRCRLVDQQPWPACVSSWDESKRVFREGMTW